MDDQLGADDPRLDANAVAGLLQEIFGVEMTVVTSRCAQCGNVALLGTCHAYTQAPGMVLRCSICQQVMLRVVRAPSGFYVDVRGAAYIRMQPND